MKQLLTIFGILIISSAHAQIRMSAMDFLQIIPQGAKISCTAPQINNTNTFDFNNRVQPQPDTQSEIVVQEDLVAGKQNGENNFLTGGILPKWKLHAQRRKK